MKITQGVNRLIVQIILLCLVGFNSNADTLSLSDHEKIDGNMLGIRQGNLLLQRGSSVLTIPIKDILSLDTSVEVKLSLVSGEVISGHVAVANTKWQVTTKYGDITVNAQDIIDGKCTVVNNQRTDLISALPSPPMGSSSELKDDATAQMADVVGLGDGTAASGSQKDAADAEKRQEVSFLRSDAVLLKDKAYELSFNLSYVRNTQFAGADDRALMSTVSVRKSLFNGLEGFLDIPFGYAQRSYAILDASGNNAVLVNRDAISWGDIDFGIKYTLLNQTPDHPEVVLSFSMQAPTGETPYTKTSLINATDSLSPFVYPFGTGHWQETVGLFAFTVFDPIVLFGGVNYTHSLPKRYYGFNMQPGDTYTTYGGFGFVASERSTFSQQIIAAYDNRYSANGVRFGTSVAPVSLKLSYTHRTSENNVIEPSIQFGLTHDATNAVFSIGYTKRFQ